MRRRKAKMPKFIRFIILGSVVLGAMSFIHLQIQINARESKLDSINAQISEQQEENDKIRNQIENGVSNEYIASVAREHGYIMPNERVFKNASSK